MARRTPIGHLEPEEHSKLSHGVHTFFLVYGAEAILPTDLEYGSPRLQAYNEQSNRTTREDALDQLEEARDVALLHRPSTSKPYGAFRPGAFEAET